jgi:hypothetical protein
MAREKQYVFSARTTEEGLKALNEVKSCFNIGWDELVIEAVSEHYNLDKAMITLPKKEKPAKPVKDEAEHPPAEEATPEQLVTVEQERPAEEKQPTKKKGKGKKAVKPAPGGAES